MDFFSALNISSAGMNAERTRMNLVSSNIANVDSTKTAEGGPYRRKDAIFSAVPTRESFGSRLSRIGNAEPAAVEVTQIVEDTSPPRLKYDPTHPEANAEGYVAYPNINVVEEMADMISASRAYEANVTAAQAAKSMAMKTLELGR